MSFRNIIVIGSGAGGVQVLASILQRLPTDLAAAVLVVQHVPGHTRNALAASLNKTSNLPVICPRDGEPIQRGFVYLAPPNRHLLVKGNVICLGNGPRENRVRPAIDALFRTTAHFYRDRVIGILLSGVLNDGTAGLIAVKAHGGRSICQDPSEAIFDGMVRSAMTFGSVDVVSKAENIPHVLTELMDGGADIADAVVAQNGHADSAEVGGAGLSNSVPIGVPSSLTCPACGGALWEVQEQSLAFFKCHVGHTYTAELMLEEQSEAVDAAAWVLLRSLEESVSLRKQMASWARLTDRQEEAAFHDLQAANAERQSSALRRIVTSPEMGGD